MRPSWGSRRAAMSRFDMILSREMIADSSRFGGDSSSCSTPFDAEPDAKRLLVRLPVDVAGALLDGVDQHHVDELHHRRLVGRFLQLEDVDLRAVVVAHDLHAL